MDTISEVINSWFSLLIQEEKTFQRKILFDSTGTALFVMTVVKVETRYYVTYWAHIYGKVPIHVIVAFVIWVSSGCGIFYIILWTIMLTFAIFVCGV